MAVVVLWKSGKREAFSRWGGKVRFWTFPPHRFSTAVQIRAIEGAPSSTHPKRHRPHCCRGPSDRAQRTFSPSSVGATVLRPTSEKIPPRPPHCSVPSSSLSPPTAPSVASPRTLPSAAASPAASSRAPPSRTLSRLPPPSPAMACPSHSIPSVKAAPAKLKPAPPPISTTNSWTQSKPAALPPPPTSASSSPPGGHGHLDPALAERIVGEWSHTPPGSTPSSASTWRAPPYTEATIAMTERLHARFPGRVGTVLQAYLFRTAADAERLLAQGIRIRLCKGAYKEAPRRSPFPPKQTSTRTTSTS